MEAFHGQGVAHGAFAAGLCSSVAGLCNSAAGLCNSVAGLCSFGAGLCNSAVAAVHFLAAVGHGSFGVVDALLWGVVVHHSSE